MARIGRIVVPGVPHHVTQRGNRREPIFFNDGDYALYRDLLAESCHGAGVSVWSYCLMPNHVHLLLVPEATHGLARALAETHRRYTGFVNARNRVTGHLFQGRYGSVAMDEEHLLAAARYVALNPVKAKLVAHAADWIWSSVRAHLAGRNDALVDVQPLLARVPSFAEFLDTAPDPSQEARLKAGWSIGRPLMDESRMRELEDQLDRPVLPRKRGRKPRTEQKAAQMELM